MTQTEPEKIVLEIAARVGNTYGENEQGTVEENPDRYSLGGALFALTIYIPENFIRELDPLRDQPADPFSMALAFMSNSNDPVSRIQKNIKLLLKHTKSLVKNTFAPKAKNNTITPREQLEYSKYKGLENRYRELLKNIGMYQKQQRGQEAANIPELLEATLNIALRDTIVDTPEFAQDARLSQDKIQAAIVSMKPSEICAAFLETYVPAMKASRSTKNYGSYDTFINNVVALEWYQAMVKNQGCVSLIAPAPEEDDTPGAPQPGYGS